MTEPKTSMPRYFVTLQGANYLAKDSKTDATIFTSATIPADANDDQRVAIGEQAEKFLDTLYPKWRDAEAYW